MEFVEEIKSLGKVETVSQKWPVVSKLQKRLLSIVALLASLSVCQPHEIADIELVLGSRFLSWVFKKNTGAGGRGTNRFS